ncbi:MAG: SUMF1/EgtB/PvdO family nonheme iron enzyme [Deltaproteobacteria bacterium]|nr:SUMF1/EgtB/PvdO family nonheme iron enzyme [Deltaproteobacteria bacterium]
MDLIDIAGGRITVGLSRERMAQLEEIAPAFPFYRETPELVVNVGPFLIATTPVTNRDYLEFVQAGGYEDRAHWTADWELLEAFGGRDALRDSTGRMAPSTWVDAHFPAGEDEHPVSGVSWFESRAYARFRKLRLPTEIEWELAARGLDGRAYPWGDT